MRRIFVCIGYAIILFYAALNLYGFMQFHRAELLVKRVEKVRVGDYLPKQPFGAGFHDRCEPDHMCRVWVSNLPFAEFLRTHRISPAGVMPADWWFAVGYVYVDLNGKVLEKGFEADDGKYHQFGTVEIKVHEDTRLFDPCIFPTAAKNPGYVPRQDMRTGTLFVDISPKTEETLMHRVFALHLDCLNTIKGCANPGNIAPNAWDDAHENEPTKFDFRKCRHDSTADF